MHRVSELQLGLNLADLGRLEEAKTHLKNLIDQDPKDMRSYLAYGSVLSDAKSYREMADKLRQGRRRHRNPAQSWTLEHLLPSAALPMSD